MELPSRRLEKCGFCAALTVLTAFAASRAQAGIAVIDQSREISVTTAQTDQTKTAEPFAPFNATLDVSTPFHGKTEKAFAQQTSTVDLAANALHVAASGQGSFSTGFFEGVDVRDTVKTQSFYSVKFTLSSASTYTLTEQSNVQTSGRSDVGFFDGSFLEDLNGFKDPQGGTNLLYAHKLFDVPTSAPVVVSGALAPGTYIYHGILFGSDETSGMQQINFSTDFAVTGKNSTAAVPLPPSAWLALATLPLAVGVMRLQKTRRWFGSSPR